MNNFKRVNPLAILGMALFPIAVFYGSQIVTSLLLAVAYVVLAMSKTGTQASVTDVTAFLSENSSILLIFSDLLAIAIILLIIALARHSIYDDLEIKKINKFKKLFPVILGIAVTSVFASNTIMSLIPMPDSAIEQYEEISVSLTVTTPVDFIAIIILAPIAEEIVFRGLCYGTLKRGFSPMFAALISSLVFGIAHGNLYQGTYAFIFGLLFALIRERSGSILSCITVHVIYNFIGTVGLTFLASHETLYIVIAIAATMLFIVFITIFYELTIPDKPKFDDSNPNSLLGMF